MAKMEGIEKIAKVALDDPAGKHALPDVKEIVKLVNDAKKIEALLRQMLLTMGRVAA